MQYAICRKKGLFRLVYYLKSYNHQNVAIFTSYKNNIFSDAFPHGSFVNRLRKRM